MCDVTQAPVLFFAPFVSSPMRIEPTWIDYNGHLNTAFYHVLFDRAVDEAFGLIGLGPDYLASRGASFFLAEAHSLFKRELVLGDDVRVTVHLVDFDDKRLHYYMEIRHSAEGWVAAASENMSIHVDMVSRKAAPFPADILANLAIMKASHSQLPKPEALGRAVGLHRRSKQAGERAFLAGTRH